MQFRKNPAPALEKVRAALAASAATIERLLGERATKLRDGEDVASIQGIDRQLDEERQTAKIHAERIAILEAEVRRQEWQRRENDRAAAIENIIAPRIEKCTALAKEVDVRLAQFCAAWSALLEESRAINAEWPSAIPRPPKYSYFSSGDGQQRILQALQTDADRVSQLARRAGSVEEPVRRAGAAFLLRIRAMKIPAPEPDTAAADEAA